jgi:hypothetical protein
MRVRVCACARVCVCMSICRNGTNGTKRSDRSGGAVFRLSRLPGHGGTWRDSLCASGIAGLGFRHRAQLRWPRRVGPTRKDGRGVGVTSGPG